MKEKKVWRKVQFNGQHTDPHKLSTFLRCLNYFSLLLANEQNYWAPNKRPNIELKQCDAFFK